MLVSKFCDHLPYCRQSQIYARDRVELDRSTLADWGGAANALLNSLLGTLEGYVMAAHKLDADDTPIPVFAPGTAETKSGRLWAYLRDDRPAGSTDPPAVLFRFDAGKYLCACDAPRTGV
jgi:transposase